MKKLIWKRLWARKYSPFLASAFLFSYLKIKEFGVAPNKMFVPEGELAASYWEEKEFNNIARNYENFLKKRSIPKYAKEYERKFKDFLAYSKRLSKINLSELTPRQIRAVVVNFIDKQIEISDLQFYAFLILEGPGVRLEKHCAKLPNGQKILQWITTPYKETKIAKSHIELINLVKNRQTGRLGEYARKYAWIPMYQPLDNPWNLDDFEAQVKLIKNPNKELADYKRNRDLAKRNYLKFFQSIKDVRIKMTVEIMHTFSYLKEMRDDYRRPSYYYLRLFLQQLAKKIDISFTEINYLTCQELLESIIQGKSVMTKSEFLQRQKAYALILCDSKVKVLSGTEAIKLGLKMTKSARGEVSGVVASKGVSRGKVRIIYHQGEFQKFKSGEVLVTTMTHPEFLTIMKKARAIVTDEGGITCHAAIVSRELGIPCIIGTKNATRILKNGDLVEVDANKGVVRKLNVKSKR